MTRPDLDAILPRVSAEDEATVDALLAKAREGVGKRPIGSRPDLDAIRARNMVDWLGNGKEELSGDVAALLAYIDELESCTAFTTRYTIGETEWAQRIATLEHMLAEERENVDTLRARVAELEARIVTVEAMKP